MLIITYNQEKYIEQTIKSVLNQITNFDFEIIIGDDCSTDNTTNICSNFQKQFPEKIILISNNENQGFLRNYFNCYNSSKGVYLAATAGDDYWCDNYKLQKQVDFLEENKDFSMCCSGYKLLFEDTNQFKDMVQSNRKEFTYNELLYNNEIAATTSIYRKSLLPTLNNEFLNVPVEDWVLYLMYAKLGRVGYLNEVFGVYRQHSNSVYSGLSNGKRGLWRFKTALYINQNFRKQTMLSFFKTEKYSIRMVLSSTDLSRNEKIDFYNSLIKLGYPKKPIIKLILTKNKIINKFVNQLLS